ERGAAGARRIDDARRLYLRARRVDAGHAVALRQEAQHLGLLEHARAMIARRPREPLSRLGGIAVAGVRLVATGHQVVDLKSRLDLLHLPRRHPPGLHPPPAPEDNRRPPPPSPPFPPAPRRG